LAQGAIGIEYRCDDADIGATIAALNHRETAVCLAAERAFQAALDGSCRTPIGGLAHFDNGTLRFRGEVLSPDGREHAATGFDLAEASESAAATAGREAGLSLKARAAPWLNL
jgi:hydroxymethylbilane synthase